jgi:hypothetical protein
MSDVRSFLTEHRVAAIGALLSIIIGALAPVVHASYYEGLILALVGTILCLNLEVLLKDEDRALKALHFLAPWAAAAIRDLAESLSQIHSSNRSDLIPFRKVSERLIVNVREEVIAMSSGQWSMKDRDEFEEFLLDSVNLTKRLIMSVTCQWHDEARWQSAWGRRYAAANSAALARNVRIQRIFINDGTTPYMKDLMEAQAVAGVDVSVCDRTKTAVPARLCHDILIFDVAWTGELLVNAAGQPINGRTTMLHDQVGIKEQQFTELLDLSSRVTTATSQVP